MRTIYRNSEKMIVGTFRNKTAVLFLTGLVLLACLLPHAPVHAQPTPIEVLQGMSDRVIAIVDADPDILNDKARMRAVAEEIVVPNVDFVLFSKWVLGKNWRKASPEQRDIFIAEFRELMINTYISSITRDDYQNQKIRYKPLRKSNDPDKVVVEAEVIPPNGPIVEVQFRMHLADSGWMVYDVVVEGVSLVATHRSSFSSIIRDKGIDGLISMLEEQNANKASSSASTSPPPRGFPKVE
jgi:phospholipid transport system substrate-binding protein